MNKRDNTLEALLRKPVPNNIEWSRIESLLVGLGAVVYEGSGSRVKFELNGKTLSIHRPHDRKEALRYQVKHVIEFLISVGIIGSDK